MVMHMRTSERGTFKRCPQRWWWANVENLEPLRKKQALWFGTAWHEGMAAWYGMGLKRGPHPAETIAAELGDMRKIVVYDEDSERNYVEAVQLGTDMSNRYVEFYGDDPQWDVIAVEQTFQVWIPHPDKRRKGRWLRYVGTADGVYRDTDTGEVWLMEHKTTSAISTSHLSLDDQAGSYWAIMNGKLRKMGVLKPGESIAGIMYNFARKALDDGRPTNERGEALNKPLKSAYVDELINHFGQDSSSEEMADWERRLPKMKVDELAALAEIQGVTVLGEVSANQPAPYHERFPVYRSVAQRRKMIERIQAEALHMEAIREGRMPLYKTPSQSGYMACTGCPFFHLCEMEEQGSEFVEDFKEAEFTVRDPYEDHHRKKSA